MTSACAVDVTPFTMPVQALRAVSGLLWRDVAADLPRFEVTGEVARGGMGAILGATDRLLGRKVAIKVCLTRDARSYQRLGREAAILSLLDDPAIPPVHELGRLTTGAPYFVTRLIDGDTLENRLIAAPDHWADALPIVATVADTMAGAHRRGVIHRDLKPSNILVDSGGRAWVVDWGIARVLGERTAAPVLDDRGPEALHDLLVTAPGTAVGTPGYWSPEQRSGEVGDPQSDIYSLGVILYRMVTGAAVSTRVPGLPLLAAVLAKAPDWLVAVIARATAPAPGDRYHSAGDLAEDLRRGLARDAAEPVRPDVGRPRGVRRGAMIVLAAAALALTVSDAATGNAACAARTTAYALASGAWTGDFGDIVFAVDGNRVVAAYDHDLGRFEGTIHGDRVIGHWCEAPYATPHDTGDAAFTLANGDRDARASGRYRYAGDDDWSGRWNLRRVAGAPRPDLVHRLAIEAWSCVTRP